jgi:hypothetical protein
MTSADRLHVRTMVIGIVLIPLTALVIYLIYGAHLFSVWPWMRFSVVMATLTCLWTYAFWFGPATREIRGDQRDTHYPVFYGLCAIPVAVIVMYPGTEALGIHSDPHLRALVIALGIIHGIGYYCVQRGVQKYLHDPATR